MPFNFYIIITVQVLTYLFFAYNEKKFLGAWDLFLSALCGIIIGLPFDILLGSLHLYTYIPYSLPSNTYPWELSHFELLVNWVLSFGIAAATAGVILPEAKKIKGGGTQESIRKKLLIFFSITLLFSLIAVYVYSQKPLFLMFACGITVVAIGEILLLVKNNVYGPIAEVIYTHNFKKILSLWLKVISIGVLYEVINLYFPFWIWLPGINFPHVIIELIVISLGYIALLHPMIVAWRLRDIT